MDTVENPIQLENGSRLGPYEIRGVLGQGGFGVTYLGYDTALQMPVAIKEYLPEQFARRRADDSIQPTSERLREPFVWGLDRFLREARTLAKFRHPNIVRVLSVFEANHTAYMVMEYERGQSLHTLLNTPGWCTEKALRKTVLPIIDGLQEVHRLGYIHRDIKPANILLRQDGSSVLLDFGSARLSTGHEHDTLTAMVSAGYAPLEQYNGAEDDQQGPWTDIYALAAVLYHAITGSAPVESTLRGSALLNDRPDPVTALATLAPTGFSQSFCAAIDWGLSFKVADRPLSLADWRVRLLADGGATAQTRMAVQAATAPATQAVFPADLPGLARDAAPATSWAGTTGLQPTSAPKPASDKSLANTAGAPVPKRRVSARWLWLLPILGLFAGAQSWFRNTESLDNTSPPDSLAQATGNSGVQQADEGASELALRELEAEASRRRVLERLKSLEANEAERLAAIEQQRIEEESRRQRLDELERRLSEARDRYERLEAQRKQRLAAERQAEQEIARLNQRASAARRELAEIRSVATTLDKNVTPAIALATNGTTSRPTGDASTALAVDSAATPSVQRVSGNAVADPADEQGSPAGATASLARAAEAAEPEALTTRVVIPPTQIDPSLAITHNDMASSFERFSSLERAIRNKDINAVKALTENSPRKLAYMQYLFNNFDTIEVALDSSMRASKREQTVRARLSIERMLRSNGDMALPPSEFSTIDLWTVRDGDWSRIYW